MKDQETVSEIYQSDLTYRLRIIDLLERIASAEEGRARAEHADQTAAEHKSKADSHMDAATRHIRNASGLGLISPPDLAIELHMSTSTLAKWRSEKRGPRSVKVGGHPMYRKADVERWLAEGGECNSTRRSRGTA